jgi:hypothetical protein
MAATQAAAAAASQMSLIWRSTCRSLLVDIKGIRKFSPCCAFGQINPDPPSSRRKFRKDLPQRFRPVLYALRYASISLIISGSMHIMIGSLSVSGQSILSLF